MNILGITVDTFPTYRQLKSVGFTEAQAEALIDSFRNLNEELVKGLVTKEEFDASIAKLQQRINEMEARFNDKIDNVEARLNDKIDNVETRLNDKISALDSKIDDVETRLNDKIGKIETSILILNNKIDGVEVKLNNKIDILSKDLTIKIGYMLAASVGLIVALIKLV